MVRTPASALRDDLQRTLPWMLFLRVLFVTALLVATAFHNFEDPLSFKQPGVRILLGLIVFTYVVTFGSAVLLRRRGWLVATAYLQIATEVAVATGLTLVTGAAESLFTFIFVLATINGAVLLYRAGAFTAAGLSTLSYAVILFLDTSSRFRLWPRVDDAGNLVPPLAVADAVFSGILNTTAFFVIAFLASYLTDQIRQAGARLSRSEDRIAELTTLHDNIVRSIPSGVITLSPAGRVTWVNAAIARLLHLDPAQCIGRPVAELFPAVPATHGGVADDVEFLFTDDGGEEHVLRWSAAPLYDASARAEGTLAIISDLTALKSMERRAALAERLAALGKLSAGLAHEVRNPLASISGALELLRNGGGANAARLLDIALIETERVNRLITEFLVFARPAPLELSDVDLAALVRETVEIARHDPHFKSRRIEVVAGEPAYAHGDARTLKQILWNLLANAADATADDGAIRIMVSGDDDTVTLEVADDGAGIPAEHLNQIFDPFFTTKDSGTGLGLATVHRLVQAHNGAIAVTSPPGGPTRFTITLPRAEGPSASVTAEGAVSTAA